MPTDLSIEKFVFRTLAKAVAALLLIAGVAYLLDFAIWRTRVASSHDGRGGMGTVEVRQVVSANMKGNKEDYYFNGVTTIDCTQSLFPQGGNNPCWWQERHPEVIAHY